MKATSVTAASNGMDKLIALLKRRGFVYPSSEIYGGLSGFYDFGPLGVALKRNIENLWWRMFVENREDMYGVDASLITAAPVLKASGHLDGFADPLVECEKCKRRFRADHVEGDKCPDCKGNLGTARAFNMMLKTSLGAVEDESSTAYLRPETAQGIFVNFKNIIDTFHPRLPFGVAQIGKAFRNEIAPRDFLFRVREFTQMEVEYFVRPNDWQEHFELWRKAMLEWIEKIGISINSVHEAEIGDGDRAHYSQRTIDFEFDYPFGRKELYGLAYRTDYDLTAHTKGSGTELNYFDEDSKERFVPHVIEPSFGVERTMLAVLLSAHKEDEMNGEKREYLALPSAIAPVKAAVFPLLKNKPELVKKAREIYTELKKTEPRIVFDDNGNIGKRYRRQDEIGTPYCVTVDFETLENNTATLRNRDTGEQKRVSPTDLFKEISQ
ncbi:MAG: glycine--tRNA ligase [Patescibacteria group bacterium]